MTNNEKRADELPHLEANRRLTGSGPSILELLAQPEGEDFDFEPQPLYRIGFRPAELGMV